MIGPIAKLPVVRGPVDFQITPITPAQADRLRGALPPSSAFPGFGHGDENLIPVGGQFVRIVIPPGGFAGFAQQTPATQRLFAQAAGRRGGRTTQRRRRKSRAAAGAPRRRRKSSSRRRATARRSRPMRLVKGSAAAKRYMAKIRRKRRRR